MQQKVHEIDFRYAPRSSWTAICRPDDPHKTLVDEKGRLLYGFQGTGFKRVYSFHVQTDRDPVRVAQTTESAKLPIVRTVFVYPQVTLELTAFGHQEDRGKRTDVVLWEIHTSESSFMTHFQIQVQDVGFVFKSREDGPSHVLIAADVCAQEKPDADFPTAFVSSHPLIPGFPTDNGPSSALRTARTLVRKGETFRGAVMIPLNHQDTETFSFDWALKALERERAFWNALQLSPIKLEVPDQKVNEMIASCARNIWQAREIKQGIPEFQVGPSLYRGLWVVDGHFLLEAAWYLGLGEEAYRGLDALLRRVKPDGSIAQHPHHTKETGIALATLVRQCELKGDMDRLRSLWPTVRRAVDYIETLREQSRSRGPEAPEYGLTPPAYGDGGLAGRRPEYTTTLWTLVGLKAVAEAAGRIGYEEDALRFKQSYESLLNAFREHASRDMKTLPDGTPYLPMLKPCGSEYIGGPHDTDGELPGIPENPWQRVTPATATWALAHAIYPGDVFDPEDSIVRNFCHLLDLIDDEEEIPTGTGWAPYQAVWNYSASFYAHVWLLAGQPDKAVDYLYAFANHASPTRVWREEHSFQRTHHGYWVGDMPHNWASAEFIRLVRHLLVMETGNRLLLLAGLPPEWLVNGANIIAESTPTRFGPVSLKAGLAEDGAFRMELRRDVDWPLRPECCELILSGLHQAGVQDIRIDGESVSAEHERVELLLKQKIIITGYRTIAV